MDDTRNWTIEVRFNANEENIYNRQRDTLVFPYFAISINEIPTITIIRINGRG